MGFRNFRLQIVLRVLGISASVGGLIWSLLQTDFLMTPIVFGLLTVFQMLALIYYSEWTMRELRRFFESFIDSDYTRRFEHNEKGKVFEALGSSFNKVVEDFRRIRIEKEEHYQYLVQIHQHVNVGLICFANDGRIDLMNQAAGALLDRPRLNEMDMIRNLDPVLHQKILTLESGEKLLYKYMVDSEERNLAIAANKFILGEHSYTLLSIQNISHELDNQEMLAWQKLIRVLTHEIMNSVTPVVSLTTAVKMILEEDDGKPRDLSSLDNEEALDIHKSINAIEGRGKGLLKFVNAYRDYTKVPVPELEQVDMVKQVEEILQILKATLGAIEVSFVRDAEQFLYGLDKNLIDQVLINVIKNAAEALDDTENPKIEILMETSGPSISIKDNGPGVPEDIRDEIFVPFYTTKSRGNGIGLSLSKQIMKAHGGNLTITTSEKETQFLLSFSG